MIRRFGIAGLSLVVVAGLGVGWWLLGGRTGVSRTSDSPTQDAYVWQRDWSADVVRAVRDQGPSLNRLVVLAAEMRWRSGHLEITRVAVPWEVLSTMDRPIGVAIRMGTYSGPFSTDGGVANGLRTVARGILDAARSNQVAVAELQLDFDCADRLLNGYRVWVEMLRREVQPVPLIITGLPSWLDQESFGSLARAADGFVLQVHSLERPRGPDDPAAVLCDPKRAQRSVEKAAQLGVPFRVALPTYSYRLAFDAQGRFLGAAAEGPPSTSAEGAVSRILAADPQAMADLVARWRMDRPASMTGILWYRLPVAGDQWNWRWRTLESVMAGCPPRDKVRATLAAQGPGLFDVQVVNEGAGDRTGPLAVRVTSAAGIVSGSDAVRGFRVIASAAGELLFTNASCRLRSGDLAIIGWMRIDAPSSVEHLRLEIIPGP
ncbi:MAG: DUF3142 domain-containing protein [Verrucomicrobiales bacterium]|nr:DUF3142 domain-containing protein [Verrucomicrobiales bacterium]